jgi:hypothetical protein
MLSASDWFVQQAVPFGPFERLGDACAFEIGLSWNCMLALCLICRAPAARLAYAGITRSSPAASAKARKSRFRVKSGMPRSMQHWAISESRIEELVHHALLQRNDRVVGDLMSSGQTFVQHLVMLQ